MISESTFRLKTALFLDMNLLGSDANHNVGCCFLQQVQLFIVSLEEVHVKAGPYVNCTHTFLVSYYGFLATYIAILYQSI